MSFTALELGMVALIFSFTGFVRTGTWLGWCSSGTSSNDAGERISD